MSESRATEAGTQRYRERLKDRAVPEHFRKSRDLWMSTIGIGSYLGDHNDETDARYFEAVAAAVRQGVNVIDTAVNYRCQRSERTIGRALKALFDSGEAARDEIVVTTKGGYIPFDGSPPEDLGRYLQDTFLGPGLVSPGELAAGGFHCVAPRYLEHQVDLSLRNLGLDTIDVYYLHNPEHQLDDVARGEFLRRIRVAFELLEKKADEGKIRFYGAATWNGFRQGEEETGYLSLQELFLLATEVGGRDHRFRVIQLPLNIAMLEALTESNQPFRNETVSSLEIADRLGLTVMTSASILQGRLAQDVPDAVKEILPELKTDAQRAIQFARSVPGVTTALVGMSRVEHVEENLETARIPPLAPEAFSKLFD